MASPNQPTLPAPVSPVSNQSPAPSTSHGTCPPPAASTSQQGSLSFLKRLTGKKATPATTRSRSKKTDSIVDKFPYKCQFFNYGCNCWVSVTTIASSWTLKKGNVTLDEPTEPDESKWSFEDYFRCWYNKKSREIIYPENAIEKLARLLTIHDDEPLSKLLKKREELKTRHQPADLMLQLVENLDAFRSLMPKVKNYMKYDMCQCGYKRPDGDTGDVLVPFFVLRTICGSNDKLYDLLMEELSKHTLVDCPNCGQEVRCEISRVFSEATPGFVVCVPRVTWRECEDVDGTLVMKQVRHSCSFNPFSYLSKFAKVI